MRVEGIAAHGGPSHGQGVPVPTTPRPISSNRRQGWTIPLLNEVPVYTPAPPAPKPKTTGDTTQAKVDKGARRITEAQRQEIIRRYQAGEIRHRIAVDMGLPRSTIDRWAARTTPNNKPAER